MLYIHNLMTNKLKKGIISTAYAPIKLVKRTKEMINKPYNLTRRDFIVATGMGLLGLIGSGIAHAYNIQIDNLRNEEEYSHGLSKKLLEINTQIKEKQERIELEKR